MGRATRLMFLAMAALSASSSVRCRAPSVQDASPGAGDAEAESVADGAEDGDTPVPDGEVDRGPGGPMTFVVRDFTVLSERVCDVNGDGVLDSAIADMGSPGAEAVAIALTTLMQGIGADGGRVAVHVPWIDHLAGPDDPDALAIVFAAADTDVPADPSDDYSGSEPFFAAAKSIDACGEPLSWYEDVRVHGGTVEGGHGVGLWVFDDDPYLALRLAQAMLSGTIGRGPALDAVICGYALVRDLGAIPGFAASGRLTMLEIFLAGGEPMGIAGLPGATPDIDVDLDGLERFRLDTEGRIEACIDGDGTEITGRDCYLDERIADAMSLTASVRGVGARFAGLVPDWRELVAGTCEAPPDGSLWFAL